MLGRQENLKHRMLGRQENLKAKTVADLNLELQTWLLICRIAKKDYEAQMNYYCKQGQFLIG